MKKLSLLMFLSLCTFIYGQSQVPNMPLTQFGEDFITNIYNMGKDGLPLPLDTENNKPVLKSRQVPILLDLYRTGYSQDTNQLPPLEIDPLENLKPWEISKILSSTNEKIKLTSSSSTKMILWEIIVILASNEEIIEIQTDISKYKSIEINERLSQIILQLLQKENDQ